MLDAGSLPGGRAGRLSAFLGWPSRCPQVPDHPILMSLESAVLGRFARSPAGDLRCGTAKSGYPSGSRVRLLSVPAPVAVIRADGLLRARGRHDEPVVRLGSVLHATDHLPRIERLHTAVDAGIVAPPLVPHAEPIRGTMVDLRGAAVDVMLKYGSSSTSSGVGRETDRPSAH